MAKKSKKKEPKGEESDKAGKVSSSDEAEKSAQEKICLKNKSLILRTNFFGKSYNKKQSFSDWIFRSFNNKKEFYLFKDVYFNPLRIYTICNIIKNIIIS